MKRANASGALALLGVFLWASGCGPLPATKSAPPPPQGRAGGTPETTPETTRGEEIPVPPRTEPVPVPATVDHEPQLDIGLAWDLPSARVSFEGTQVLDVQSSTRPGVHSSAGPVDFQVSGSQLLVTPRDRLRAVPMLVLHAGDTVWVGPADLATVIPRECRGTTRVGVAV